MNKNEVLELFLNPKTRYTLRMGAQSLSKRYGTAIEVIKAARKLAHQKMRDTKEYRKLPKVLILDIETAPIKAYVWGLWKQNVYIDQIESDWFMLTWSAKWLFDDYVFGEKLTGQEAINEDDSGLVKKMWKLLEAADIVIAHNAKNFDIPKLNARFIQHGLGPTTPYQMIDTLQVARKQFRFSSNKLEALARNFGMEGKIDTTFELWKDCMHGDNKALADMLTYNIQDVELLEEVYLKLRPWIKGHPNTGVYMESDDSVCPNCGCNDIRMVGQYVTHVSKFNTFRCADCGAIGRFRNNLIEKENREHMTVSVVR